MKVWITWLRLQTAGYVIEQQTWAYRCHSSMITYLAKLEEAYCNNCWYKHSCFHRNTLLICRGSGVYLCSSRPQMEKAMAPYFSTLAWKIPWMEEPGMMLNIFSCAFWPSVFLLWRNVYLDLPPTFWLGCFSFILSCMSYLYIFDINFLSVTSFANTFSHSAGCLFV